MKCHAGVEFPNGKPCPKCNAGLGEVCWPGINADLLALAQMRAALQTIADWRKVNISGEYEHSLRDIIRSITDCAAAALDATSDSSQIPGTP